LSKCCNGTLEGLVAITGPCAVVRPWAAIIIGALAATGYYWFSQVIALKIDDPVDASPLHLGTGIIGLICVGLFADRDLVRAAYGRDTHWGLLVGGGGEQLAVQIIMVLCILGYVGTCSMLFMYPMHRLGWWRMSIEKENRNFEQHMMANKAEEGFANIVTVKKQKGKSIEDMELEAEEDLGIVEHEGGA